LQETKAAENKYSTDLFDGYKGYYYSCVYNPGYSGTAVFTRHNPISVVKGIGIKEFDQEGRVITLEFKNFYFVGTYIPNAGAKQKDGANKGWPQNLDVRMKWDVAFHDFLRNLNTKKPIIWTGDLNVARLEIDLTNPKTNKKTAGFTDKERNSFENFLKGGYVDTYREFSPGETDCYTFWSYRQGMRSRNIGWRLDYFIVSKSLLPKVKSSYIRKHIMGSDHCPIVLHLEDDTF